MRKSFPSPLRLAEICDQRDVSQPLQKKYEKKGPTSKQIKGSLLRRLPAISGWSEGPEPSWSEFDLLSLIFGGASDKITCLQGLLLITSESMSRSTTSTYAYYGFYKRMKKKKEQDTKREKKRKANLLKEKKVCQEGGENRNQGYFALVAAAQRLNNLKELRSQVIHLCLVLPVEFHL